MTKPTPLKDKRIIAFDMVGFHPVQTKYDKTGDLVYIRDLKDALQGIINEAEEWKVMEGLFNKWLPDVYNGK